MRPGYRAVRPVVPADRGAGRVRADPHADAAAGADDGVGVFAVAVGDPDPVPAGRGPVRRLVALIGALGAVPRTLVWDGEGRSGGGGRARPN